MSGSTRRESQILEIVLLKVHFGKCEANKNPVVAEGNLIKQSDKSQAMAILI